MLKWAPSPTTYEKQTNQAQKQAKWDEFWWYNTWYLMLDERRNLLPDDLQWFGMRILTQKFALFGFMKVDGKKMVLEVWTDGFCMKTVTLRYLSCAWVIWAWLQSANVLCWGKRSNQNLISAKRLLEMLLLNVVGLSFFIVEAEGALSQCL